MECLGGDEVVGWWGWAELQPGELSEVNICDRVVQQTPELLL